MGKRPVPIRALGENLVLFRTPQGQVAALEDRCPHRGTMLSRGRVIFPGTLSCGYHGWTFNAIGECVAAIVEGPESKVPGQVQVKWYRTEERLGMVWAYMGEGEAPALDEDLPAALLDPNAFSQNIVWEWKTNWRHVTDNYADMCHAPFVHRTSLRMLFRKVAAWAKMSMQPLPDGKGFNVRAVGGGLQAEYPGLGKFPKSLWWRAISGIRGPTPSAELRMPGYLVLCMRDPFFGVDHVNIGWPVPVDEHRTQYVGFIVTHPKTRLGKFVMQLWWHLGMQPLQIPFLRQDQRLIESQSYSCESLSTIDTGIVVWRKFAAKTARQAVPQKKDSGVPVDQIGTV
ncbi:MAG: Rieske 2Fe-2S domain-containing protein, partial [Deltaproteobacteria bacterium]|nr:Rieske 2Fe-2S domain-containing protein [Deltaproteobacteria bacterium]